MIVIVCIICGIIGGIVSSFLARKIGPGKNLLLWISVTVIFCIYVASL